MTKPHRNNPTVADNDGWVPESNAAIAIGLEVAADKVNRLTQVGIVVRKVVVHGQEPLIFFGDDEEGATRPFRR